MTHWFYLIIFALILFVPQIIRDDYSWLAEENFESLVIFCLGLVGFFVFLWREEQFRFHIREKKRYQKEATSISKDLIDSYSYIGEINRKLEILKNLALGLPEADSFTPEKRREIFDTILQAVSVLGKTDAFALFFVNTKEKILEETMFSGKKLLAFESEHLHSQRAAVAHMGRYTVIRSSRSIRQHAAFIVLDQKQVSVEDADLLRALASQALFVYVWEKHR